jgi:hypothetical protein
MTIATAHAGAVGSRPNPLIALSLTGLVEPARRQLGSLPGSSRTPVTILCYELLRVRYARTLADSDGTAMLINKRRFSSTL